MAFFMLMMLDRSAGVHDPADVVVDGNEADGDIRIISINCNIICSVMNTSRSIISNMKNAIRTSINIIISIIVNRSSDVSVTYACPETTADKGLGKRRGLGFRV